MSNRAQTPRQDEAGKSAAGYRPHLDGVRALAVILVILFHLGYAWMPGGFIGVDVFFVLSGYLITGLLLREISKRGRVNLVNFYSRRFRRLLPAATVVLLAVVALSLWLLDAVDKNSVGGDVRASALYVANWHFIAAGADYFAPGDVPSPLTHFWSLAVEEQFYFVWPALFFLLWFGVARFARRRRGDGTLGVLVGVLIIAAVSIVLSLTLVPSTNAYYSTFTRAYELCVGAILAIAARRYAGKIPNTPVLRSVGAVAIVVGVGALIALAATIPNATDYPGTAALLVTGSTLLVIFALEFLPLGIGHKALGQAAPAAVGRISYSLYLWHWPVIVFAPLIATKLLIAAPRYRGVQIATMFLLAVISYFIIESPIRFRLGRFAKPVLVVAVGLGVSLAVALIAPQFLKPQAAYGQKALIAVRDLAKPENCPYFPKEWKDPSDDLPCVYRKGGPRVIAFVGDSHAQQWQPAIKALAERYNFTVIRATRGGCPANWVTTYLYDEQGISRPDTDCDRWRARVYRDLVKVYNPELIFVATRSQEKGLRDGGRSVNKDKPDHLRIWAAGWDKTLRTLTAGTGTVVVARLLPTLPWRVPACLATASTAAQAKRCDSRVAVDQRILPYNAVIDQLPAKYPRVIVIDPTTIVCPKGFCPAIKDGIVVHRDDNHISATFARSVAKQFREMLERAGALKP
ncbi:MAG: acyltransferase family protein [Actinomycetota bacterium]